MSAAIFDGPAGLKERLGVVIPAYRVADRIGPVLAGIPAEVDLIVLVDDASPDGTAERASESRDPRLIVLRHAANRGVGAATLTGLDRAVAEGCTVVVKMDGDGQMDPALVGDLVRPIFDGDADFVKGNRFGDPTALRRMPFARRTGNLALSFLTKMSTGCWQVFDPTNGFFAVDSSVYMRLNRALIHERYFFEISLLLALNLQGAVIQNVTMPASYGGAPSSMSLLRVLREFPLLLVRQFLRRIWLQYFVLGFSVASLFLVCGTLLGVFGTAWGAWAWARSIRDGIPATTGTVMIAVLPLILGFQLLIQTIVFDVTRAPTRPQSRLWRWRSLRPPCPH
jgi:glycosyltransferase involved in cell wall biosynthesis